MESGQNAAFKWGLDEYIDLDCLQAGGCILQEVSYIGWSSVFNNKTQINLFDFKLAHTHLEKQSSETTDAIENLILLQ